MEEVIKLLLTYGPGGVIAALVVLGVLIPKSIYDREVKRGDTATESNAKNAESLKNVTEALRIVTETNKDIKDELTTVKSELSSLSREFRDFRIGRGA